MFSFRFPTRGRVFILQKLSGFLHKPWSQVGVALPVRHTRLHFCRAESAFTIPTARGNATNSTYTYQVLHTNPNPSPVRTILVPAGYAMRQPTIAALLQRQPALIAPRATTPHWLIPYVPSDNTGTIAGNRQQRGTGTPVTP